MMDPFLKVACQVAPTKEKVAFCHSNDHDWLEKFKDTPLLEQAVALEQSDIQNEISEKQYNTQSSDMQRSFWNNRDQIQLQKRMLELQLVQMQSGAMEPPGPPMTEPPTGPEAGAATAAVGGETTPVPETGMKTASLVAAGDIVGETLAKMALSLESLKGLGTGALDMVKANPTKALSAAGAVGGGVLGAATAKGEHGQGPTIGQRLRRGVGGAALGAGAGAVAGQGVHVGRGMMEGKTFGQALGGHLEGGVSNALGRARETASNPELLAKWNPGATTGDAHALIDQHMPSINRLQEGIASHITNNPRLQFGGAK